MLLWPQQHRLNTSKPQAALQHRSAQLSSAIYPAPTPSTSRFTDGAAIKKGSGLHCLVGSDLVGSLGRLALF